MSDITLKQAQAAVEAALAKAKELNILEAVAVVDEGGNLIAFAADDCVIDAGRIGAIEKAMAAALFNETSAFLEANPNATQVAMAIAFGAGRRPLYRQGAVPIVLDGMVAGAVGCGGSSVANDELCAIAGAEVVK